MCYQKGIILRAKEPEKHNVPAKCQAARKKKPVYQYVITGPSIIRWLNEIINPSKWKLKMSRAVAFV